MKNTHDTHAGQGNAATLKPWEEPVNGADFLNSLAAFVLRYLMLPRHAAEVIALWIVHTYLLDVTDYTPYLHVRSPVPGCGKSTLLDLLSNLAHQPQFTGSISPAALYRRIARLRPTMLVDELDTQRGDGFGRLRGVLNTGFHRSGTFTVCEGDNHKDTDFSTFCPKVVAGIGRLPATVESRSIAIPLKKATRDDLETLKKVRSDRIREECLPYRRKAVRLAQDIREQLRGADPDLPSELGGRESDVWRPLIAIADAAGGQWPEAVRDAARTLSGSGREESDHGILVLQDIRALFERMEADKLASKVIVDELNELEDRPWPEYRNDRPLTVSQLAALLGRFGIRPKNIRVGEDVPKGYELGLLKPAFDTYLSPSATDATQDDA